MTIATIHFRMLGALLVGAIGCASSHSTPIEDAGYSQQNDGGQASPDAGTTGPAAHLLDPCDPLSVNSRCVGETIAECTLVQGEYRLTASTNTCLDTAPCYEGSDAASKVTADCGCTLGTNQGCSGNLSQCYRYTAPDTKKTLQICSCIPAQSFCLRSPLASPSVPVDSPDHTYIYTCHATDDSGAPYPYPQLAQWFCPGQSYAYSEYCIVDGCLACSPREYIVQISGGAIYHCDNDRAQAITDCPATICAAP